MEYHTPGVYIREVDSGAKPIASVATSIPGFLGMFEFKPGVDAIAITGSDGKRQIRGKVVPQLVDATGKVTGDGAAFQAGPVERVSRRPSAYSMRSAARSFGQP